jgi:hypothetical protein
MPEEPKESGDDRVVPGSDEEGLLIAQLVEAMRRNQKNLLRLERDILDISDGLISTRAKLTSMEETLARIEYQLEQQGKSFFRRKT